MKNVKAYTFEELNDEQKSACIEKHRDVNDCVIDDLLEETIKDTVQHELVEARYTFDDIEVFYSLSNCQGDGVSFRGTIAQNGKEYEVRKSHCRYSHEFTMYVYDGDTFIVNITEDMRIIARTAEKIGYGILEDYTEDEAIEETLIVNDYHFLPENDYSIV